jgi:hypothetical protein
MNRITLIPQIGIEIEGVGQLNFGDSRAQVLNILGSNDDQRDEFRLRYFKYGFFIDFKKSDDSFEAIEFWNDYDKNVSEVYIYDNEVLNSNADELKIILQEKNNNLPPIEGWYVDIDIIYSGGNPKYSVAMIEEAKANGTFDGDIKINLLDELEKSKHFIAFGIGYKGYCQNGLKELAKILNR